MNKNKILKYSMLVVLIIGILIGLFDPDIRDVIAHPRRLKAYIADFRDFAPIVFIVLYALRALLIVFPVSIFAIASGALFGRHFGFAFAFIFSMLGAFLSASVAFGLGKGLMSNFVQRHFADKIKLLTERRIGDFKLILYLRLIMIMPFDAFGYVAGAANIKYKDFILGTMLGIIPEFALYAYLGSTGGKKDISIESKILMVTIVFGLILVAHFGKKFFEKLLNKK